LAPAAEARWERIEEAGAANVQQHFTVTFNKDGTDERQVKRVIEIRRDDARQSFGTVSFSYNAATSRILSIRAETIVDGRKFRVGKEHIEDKPVKSDDLGFDRINRVTIAFPRVEVGAKLSYEYTLKTHTVPVAGFFDEDFTAGIDGIPDEGDVIAVYRAKLPLIVKADDPHGHLRLDRKSRGGYEELTVTLAKPAYYKVVNEKQSNYFPKLPNPMVYLASTEDWSVIGKTLAPQYEAAFARKLPQRFEAVLETARGKDGFEARADAFVENLLNNVRYMGDWRTVKGGHVPRPLEEIARTGFGDCKDLSLVTAKALREMGYKAHVAFVWRGELPPRERPLPAVGAFNHAIVRAEDGTGKTYWIDPTNQTAFSRGIRPDIAGRPSLVVDGSNSRLESIPALSPKDGGYALATEYEFQPKLDEAMARHTMRFTGYSGELMTGAELAMPKAQIDELLIRNSADDNTVSWSEVAPYDLSTRVIKDLEFKVATRSKWTLPRTSAGHGFSVPGGFEELSKLDLQDRVSGYYFGAPATHERTVAIASAELIGKPAEPCKIESKWLDGERTIEAQGGAIIATRRYATKAYGIAAEELRSEEFKALQGQLKSCFGPYLVIFRTGDAETSLSH
jgi:transglutaminase-like putative cysteine protease